MTAEENWLTDQPSSDGFLRLAGDWRIQHAAALKARLAVPSTGLSGFDGTGIKSIDAAGAFLLLEFAGQCGVALETIRLNDSHRDLVAA
ncbi:MAG TPA: hypothetical protein VKO38_01615, partial [Wenzhouxiangella sp.]|nr:hypothetical protein [Wenzhouxiangella sp.]